MLKYHVTSNIKIGRWSEISFRITADTWLAQDLFVNILSINAILLSPYLVGAFISGSIEYKNNMSIKFPVSECDWFNKFTLNNITS